jgi:hypothetical protein
VGSRLMRIHEFAKTGRMEARFRRVLRAFGTSPTRKLIVCVLVVSCVELVL